MKRGEVYLVNFGKKYNSEFGKVRPAVVVQNDVANRNIDKVAFRGVTVAPMTTMLAGGTLRVRIPARDRLEKTSEICVNEICTLDLSRFSLEHPLTALQQEELDQLDQRLREHLSL